MTFRRIDSYATEDKEKLADQLSRLEDNIADALSPIPEALRFSDWVSSDVRVTQLAYGQVTRADTTGGSLKLLLPSLSRDTIGRITGVKVKGGSSAALEPVESTAYIDGSSGVFLPQGLYLYVHDGEEWMVL